MTVEAGLKLATITRIERVVKRIGDECATTLDIARSEGHRVGELANELAKADASRVLPAFARACQKNGPAAIAQMEAMADALEAWSGALRQMVHQLRTKAAATPLSEST